ncbi:hypothetical protein Rsub_00623 [Raphidocelis subcapitata]|uniref:BZIP domain-containing protein n=1 Tax=Raphidocelis subcapitata TaxID=307507 RepID=A0A2V0NKP8_9CHLO|nr:hypothetical protein Rsub_00623 [Raphidocelis subcapitata]|eukprot:GBF87911.1 hypothetical protein Rsub_00623 [Raphidocelis subcapitata]
MLDLQALPSLERFDSQLLHAFDLFKATGDGANVAALLDAGTDSGPPSGGLAAPQLPDAADAVLQAMFTGGDGGGGGAKGGTPSSAGLSSQAAALASFSPAALPGLFTGASPSLPMPPLFGAAPPQAQATADALQGPTSPAPAQRRRGRPSGRSRKAAVQAATKAEPTVDDAGGAVAAATPEVAAVAASSQAQGGGGTKRKRAPRSRAKAAQQGLAAASGHDAAMEEGGECGDDDSDDDDYADDDHDDSLLSSQSPKRRARPALGPGGIPWCEMSITPGMDEQTRAKIRREKNRVAARKCRAKKMAFMVDLQTTLRTLAITWHRMFGREVRLREAMKRLVTALWWRGAGAAGAPGGGPGYSAHDAIIGLESGTLEVDELLRTLEAPPGRGGGPAGAPAAAAPSLAGAAGLAPHQQGGAALMAAGGSGASAGDTAFSLHQQMAAAYAVAGGGGEGDQGGAARVPVSGFAGASGAVRAGSLQLAPSLGQLLAMHQQLGGAAGAPTDAPSAAAGWPAVDWPASGSTGAPVGGVEAAAPLSSDVSGDSKAVGGLDAEALAAADALACAEEAAAAAAAHASAALGRT